MDRIARLRRRTRRLLGLRVEVELFDGREFEGVLIRVRRNFLVLIRRSKGVIIRTRIPFRLIEEIERD